MQSRDAHSMTRTNRSGRSASHAEPRSVDLALLAGMAQALGVPAFRWTGERMERLA